MDPKRRPHVLCVDDEPEVLEGLKDHLRRRYEVSVATSGKAGLAALEDDRGVAVVVSDVRMPAMDGATFLAQARRIVPNAARILLTGQTDLDSAISAVNDGQILRFLTKPCPPATFLAAVDAGAEHHRLVTAERVLLEQTLRGSIQALTDVLALTNPLCFGRATRIKQRALDLAEKLGLPEVWQVDVAAMLSQLGFITLPPETAEKVFYERPLSADEKAMVEKAPAVTEQLLCHIPRLEVVCEILACSRIPFRHAAPPPDPERLLIEKSARVLRAAADFDALEAQGNSAHLAVDTMRGRADRYDPEVLAALVELWGAGAPRQEVREVGLAGVREGMTFAEDVKLSSGSILVARGYEGTR
jgi:response regulator RpfG family c-di-GMP phosphodiesterase